MLFDFSLRIIRIKYCEVNSRSGESVCMNLSSLIRVRTLHMVYSSNARVRCSVSSRKENQLFLITNV